MVHGYMLRLYYLGTYRTFGKFGGSRQSSEIALRWPENEISVRFHPWGAHPHTHCFVTPCYQHSFISTGALVLTADC